MKTPNLTEEGILTAEGWRRIHNITSLMTAEFKKRHAHILREAEQQVAQAVMVEWTKLCGIKADQYDDEEGGGWLSLQFPEGWTVDDAEKFVSVALGEVALRSYSGGAGKPFCQYAVGPIEGGGLVLSWRYGMDI